jgi:RHS repeat-associated protein
MTHATACCISVASSSTPNFTGKERDTESGNDYFGARYYASSMGRFMSPDWSSIPWNVPYSDLGNPQSLNLYVYGANNPLRYRDLDGHMHQDCGSETGSGGTGHDMVVNANCSDVPDFWDHQWWGNHANQARNNTKRAWNNTVRFAHSPRGKLLGKSIKHFTIGGLKAGAAVAGVAAAPETLGASLALTAYGVVGATGDLTAGTTELLGSILGSDEDIEKVSNAGDAVTAITTVSGATTLVVTGGNVEAASHAASIEDLFITGGTSAVTGEALRLGDKLGVMDDGSDLW